MTDTPLGYSLNTPPETPGDVFSKPTADRAVTITKAVLQKYINDFLDPKGRYRGYLKATSSPSGLQFVTELTFDEDMKAEPNGRKTYLARFFAENTGRLPCVLIVDQGLENVDPGINAVMSRFQVGNIIYSKVAFIAKINISVMVATLKQEDTDILGSLMTNILGVMTDVVGHVIREKGQPWEVRTPLTINPGQISNVPIEGDTKTQVWTRNVDMALEYETLLTFQQEVPALTMEQPIESFIGNRTVLPEVLNLQPNQKISLGSAYQLVIRHMTYSQRLTVSDPRVALVNQEQPFFLQPRAQGKAILYILDSALPQGEDLTNDQQNKQMVLAIPFEVTR